MQMNTHAALFQKWLSLSGRISQQRSIVQNDNMRFSKAEVEGWLAANKRLRSEMRRLEQRIVSSVQK